MPIIPIGWGDKKTTGRPGLRRTFPMAIDVPQIANEIVRAERFKVYTIVVAADGSGDVEDIQSGVDSLPSNGGIIIVGSGSYDAFTLLKSNVTIMGSGGANVTGMITIGDHTSAYTNITIRNMEVSGGTNCIYLDGGLTFVRIEDCELHGASSDGINSRGNSNLVLSKNQIYSNGRYGILVSGDTDVQITENQIYSNVQGILVGLSATYGSCVKVIISNNIVRNNTQEGVWVYGTNTEDVTINSNIIHDNGYNGILLDSANAHLISSNQILDNSQDSVGTYAGIKLNDDGASYAEKNIIIGNQIRDTTGGHQGYGILENSSGDDYNVIVGNILRRNTVGNLQLLGENDEAANNISLTV